MKQLKLFSALLMCLFALSFTACGDDDEDISGGAGDSGVTDMINLVGTKWTLTNWDYSLGDDYIGLHDETYRFFFYSSTEGAFYYGKKDSYSDQGSSRKRVACHFKYSVSGNSVQLEYLTDKMLYNTYLTIENDILIAGELEFSKGNISSTDTQWLNSVHGTTGSCSWYSDMCGKLWIVGNGAMADYSSYNSTPWAKNDRTPNNVVVCDGVTYIGSYAFANVSIAKVEMPDKSLKQIGKCAFKKSSIKSIWISQNATNIGDEAFADCTNLKDINIPDEIVEIGNYAFSGCTALNEFELEFGKNLRKIGDYAFEGGSASYVTFAEGVQSIAKGAFIGNYCNISKELILPNSLNSIDVTVFEGAYKKIVIGTGITEIGEKAFISGATSGKMYINQSTPPSAGNSIIVERTNWSSVESRWTLYVPKGCKSAYSKKAPWNKFKSIIEDSSLAGGNSNNNSGDDEEYDCVDLGLSVKWATCNIGAESPEDYGDYFAWGETEPKATYTEGNCKTMDKNIGEISGNPAYDAATANWGGSWRMPTYDECQELVDNCTWTWTTQNGVKGYKVKSKKNGNNIFLPAAGYRDGSSLHDAGYRGYYWSSSPSEEWYFAYYFAFESSEYFYAWDNRFCGSSVRPVTK